MKDKKALTSRILFYISLGLLVAITLFFVGFLVYSIVDAKQNIENGSSSASLGAAKVIVLLFFEVFGLPGYLIALILSVLSLVFQKKANVSNNKITLFSSLTIGLSIIVPILYIVIVKMI